MSEQEKATYGIDVYMDWVKKEGLPVTEEYGVDLCEVPTADWPRYGCKGAAVHMKGRCDFSNMFLFEIAPGRSTAPQRHLFDDVFYVLEGRGSTQVEFADGHRHAFEWGPRSLFAIPLNARHRHFNGSGKERALLVSTTDMPLVMNVFHNEAFVFENDFNFLERAGKEKYYTGDGDRISVWPGKYMWQTNFVPDLASIELQNWGDRGGGGSNIMFVLADSIMHAHISEMPAGTYKKGHRHGPGYHVMCTTGHGYSLFWYEGEKDFLRIDWKHGVVFPPADRQFHQHFNTSQEPVRYLATGVGGLRYPLTAVKRQALIGKKSGELGGANRTSIKEGGDQIEYEDQDPRIHRIWLEEMKKNGVTPKMDKFNIA
jgi:mannose-6-phosphate isomerase-like protein (cupin superfamily)